MQFIFWEGGDFMVIYNREFLVPYLKNLCALYFAKRKLEVELEDQQDRLNRSAERSHIPTPTYSPKTIFSDWGAGGWLCFAFCLPLSIMAINFIVSSLTGNVDWMSDIELPRLYEVVLFFLMDWEEFLGILLVLAIIIGSGYCLYFIALIIETVASNHKNYQQYLIDCDEARNTNKDIDKLNDIHRRVRYAAQEQISRLKQDLTQVNRLIARAYDANIIPGPSDRYRTMYCVVHLYEFFSRGRSCDMDAALELYVLEQIKDRLDTIIRQNSDILLNQELMYANQMRSMEDRRNYQNSMLQKINRLNCSAEEANQYRRAIDSRLETLEFFARDNYIRNLFS